MKTTLVEPLALTLFILTYLIGSLLGFADLVYNVQHSFLETGFVLLFISVAIMTYGVATRKGA